MAKNGGLLRQIIWPETKKWTWFTGVVGALASGLFTNIAKLLLGVPLVWVVVGFILGVAGGFAWCYLRARKFLNARDDDRPREARIPDAVDCWACGFFRFFSLCCVAFILATITHAGEASTEVIARSLASIGAKLETISKGVEDIEKKVAQAKPETSPNPRKELANRGVMWTVDAFFNAIRQGDGITVKLFLDGRMTTDAPDSQGRPLPVMLALNESNAPEMLNLLVGAGLDVNHSYDVAGALKQQRMTLLSRAIEKGATPLAQALVEHHANINAPIQTFGAMGLTRDTYPLAAAIYWKRWDIAQLLLDAGADIGAGDYAAYREAHSLREKSNLDSESKGRLDALVPRLEPRGSDAARMANELRLQEVEQRLNQVALQGLRAAPGSVERKRLDAEYDQLQIERIKLRSLSQPR